MRGRTALPLLKLGWEQREDHGEWVVTWNREMWREMAFWTLCGAWAS